MKFANTQYGFSYGSASVVRMCHDDKKGWVEIQVRTPKRDIQIYCTKTGKMRVFDEGKELGK